MLKETCRAYLMHPRIPIRGSVGLSVHRHKKNRQIGAGGSLMTFYRSTRAAFCGNWLNKSQRPRRWMPREKRDDKVVCKDKQNHLIECHLRHRRYRIISHRISLWRYCLLFINKCRDLHLSSDVKHTLCNTANYKMIFLPFTIKAWPNHGSTNRHTLS